MSGERNPKSDLAARALEDCPGECASDLVLDRYLLHELSEVEKQAIARHLHACSRCCQRLSEFAHGRAEFERVAVATCPRVVRPELEPRLRLRKPMYRALSLIACVGALILIALSNRSNLNNEIETSEGEGKQIELAAAVEPGIRDRRDAVSEGQRAKGQGTFRYYIAHGEQVRPGKSVETVYPGDRLRFAVKSSVPGYIAILSIDASQAVSIYYPQPPNMKAIVAGFDELLPLSTRLDGVLGLERVFAVLCASAWPIAELEARIKSNAAHPAFPPGCTTETIEMHKIAG